MNREEVRAETEAKCDKRTAAVRRTILSASDITSAAEQLRRGLSELPGVSADPLTVPDIMTYVDAFIHRMEQIEGRV